ncbi:MAG: SDR family oxidoreductase [Bacteroidales bacterium]|nr:SDR family oxidoreductase [Bacteroidales bacterium]
MIVSTNLNNKVVIVTGASSGIGLASAIALLKEGARVVFAARSIESINTKVIEPYRNQYLLLKTDISKEEDCRLLIRRTVDVFGGIDVLVNNAGVSMRALFEDVELSVMRQLMDVNFWGAVYCTKFAMPYLLKSKGSVVGVSSIAGFKGLPARAGYTASKYALHGFLEVLRTENINKGLHVMLLAPGFTASNIRNTALLADGTPQGDSPRKEEKMMTAEEVAQHLIKGLLKRKRQVILTPIGKATVLINKFFPRFVDKMVYKSLAKEPNSPLK